MRVRTSVMRFLNGRRYRPGSVFDWPDERPLPKGCERVDAAEAAEPGEPAARRGRGRSKSDEPQTIGEIARRDAEAMDARLPRPPATAS